MNTIATFQPSTATARRVPASAIVSPMPTRYSRRERDFGIGYGNSSGYASTRQYVSNWAPPRFKFA